VLGEKEEKRKRNMPKKIKDVQKHKEETVKAWKDAYESATEERDLFMPHWRKLREDCVKQPWLKKPRLVKKGWWLFSRTYYECSICQHEVQRQCRGMQCIFKCDHCGYAYAGIR